LLPLAPLGTLGTAAARSTSASHLAEGPRGEGGRRAEVNDCIRPTDHPPALPPCLAGPTTGGEAEAHEVMLTVGPMGPKGARRAQDFDRQAATTGACCIDLATSESLPHGHEEANSVNVSAFASRMTVGVRSTVERSSIDAARVGQARVASAPQ